VRHLPIGVIVGERGIAQRGKVTSQLLGIGVIDQNRSISRRVAGIESFGLRVDDRCGSQHQYSGNVKAHVDGKCIQM
jgi:hypothetical protein